MAKYLALWKTEFSELPTNRKERVRLVVSLIMMVKEDLKSGFLSDWGDFAGLFEGYCITNTTEDFGVFALKYSPYIKFTAVYTIQSADQVLENFKKLAQAQTVKVTH